MRSNLRTRPTTIESAIGSVINATLARVGLQVTRTAKPFDWPVEASPQDVDAIVAASHYSMTPKIRMWALLQSLKYVVNNDVAGDFVECGVWRGGNLGLMAQYIAVMDENRRVFGFDTFDGMPDPTDEDVDLLGQEARLLMQAAPKDEAIVNIHAFAGIEMICVKDSGRSLGLILRVVRPRLRGCGSR